MDLQLEGRVAIVTGAGRGLGRAAAEAFLEEGGKVLAAARSEDELIALQADWPGQVIVQVCDMMDREAVADLPRSAIEAFGCLDVVVNNAGVAPACQFLEQTLEVWDRVMAVNVTAVAVLCQAAGPHLIDQGEGSIINVASTTGLRGKASLAAYSASKGAVMRLTEALAAEWTDRGVRVNTIAPGAFETDAQRAVLEDPNLLDRRVRRIPAGRMGEPHELGSLVVYLASPASGFVSGSTFVIDGGEANKL